MPETSAQLNERIATWLGWRMLFNVTSRMWVDPTGRHHGNPPDFAGDLNTWGPVYERFRADRWTTSSAFLKRLLADLDVGNVTGDYGWLTMIFSTALQRAKALCAVIGGTYD